MRELVCGQGRGRVMWVTLGLVGYGYVDKVGYVGKVRVMWVCKDRMWVCKVRVVSTCVGKIFLMVRV